MSNSEIKDGVRQVPSQGILTRLDLSDVWGTAPISPLLGQSRTGPILPDQARGVSGGQSIGEAGIPLRAVGLSAMHVRDGTGYMVHVDTHNK